MTAFDPEAELRPDRGLRLMINTSVTLFWRSTILEENVAWLAAHGYQVTRLDASNWMSESDLHRNIAASLDFPDYYGHNLAALNDCMRDVVDQDYGWAPNTTGLALVLTNYDTFATRCPHPAQVVLDIMADRSRSAALFGRRLMCLVHSNDPHIRFEPVGCNPVMWNDAEWQDAWRR